MEFEIFKVGTHTSDKGITKSYSQDDLNFIASSYQPSEHEAPIVIGHPEDNAPAYGWIESLKVVGDKLIAKAKDVIPEFTDVLKKGLFKKRSISLDNDGKLRHVGFLGAAAPAVKGLADIQFSTPSAISYDLDILNENEDENDDKPRDIYPTINEKLISSFSEKLDLLQQSLVSFSKNNNDENIKNISTEINDIKFKLDTSEFESKLNDKLENGSLTPAMKTNSMNFLKFINSQNFTEDFDFTTFKSKVNSLLNDFIESIPKIIYYENFAEKPEEDYQNYKEDYSGLPVDQESSALHKKAFSLMKKENITYESAILKLVKSN